MTDPTPRRRVSKGVLRAWAWVAGALAFLAPFRMLEASPKPPSDQAEASRGHRPVLVVRKITRVVVVREQPADAPVRYVYAPSESSTPSTGTTAAPSSSTSTNTAPAAAAPPPAPSTTTGGS